MLYWNTAKTHGTEPAKMATLLSTFFSREKNCPFADSAGAQLQKEKRNGEAVKWKVLA